MRLTRLFEALDDRDEFQPDRCEYCENVLHYDPSNIGDDFHVAHVESEGLATDKTGWFDDDVFINEMRKRGYVKQYHLQQYLWTKTAPLKENLDDKDSFSPPCSFFSCETRDDHHDFHAAHEEAEKAGYNSEERKLEDDTEKRFDIYNRIFNAVMAKHGYLPEYVYGLGWWKPK